MAIVPNGSGVPISPATPLYDPHNPQVRDVVPAKRILTTTYTLRDSDNGQILEFENAAAVTVTVPKTLFNDWSAGIFQAGVGQVTIAAATGATVINRSGHTKLAGLYAEGNIRVQSNNPGRTAARAILSGDTAA